MKNNIDTLLIVNPISGGMDKEELSENAIAALEERGFHPSLCVTTKAGDARLFAREAVRCGVPYVIVAGGDGTVNETASALVDTDTALGILPCGSGNGLARHLEIPMDMIEALDIISRRDIMGCDYGTANGRPFFCTFGMGFDAEVSMEFASSKGRGPMNYLRSIFKELMRFRPSVYHIEAEGRSFDVEAFAVAACNASQYGNNAFIAPYASIRDGVLDLIVIHRGTPLTGVFAGVDLFTGFIEDNTLIQKISIHEAIIKREAGYVHLDGEPGEMESEIRVKCNPGGIKLFVNKDKKPFRPFFTPMQYWRNEIEFLGRKMLGL